MSWTGCEALAETSGETSELQPSLGGALGKMSLVVTDMLEKPVKKVEGHITLKPQEILTLRAVL